VHREANLIVGTLAKFGFSLPHNIRNFDVAPSFLSLVLSADCKVVAFLKGF